MNYSFVLKDSVTEMLLSVAPTMFVLWQCQSRAWIKEEGYADDLRYHRVSLNWYYNFVAILICSRILTYLVTTAGRLYENFLMNLYEKAYLSLIFLKHTLVGLFLYIS